MWAIDFQVLSHILSQVILNTSHWDIIITDIVISNIITSNFWSLISAEETEVQKR